MFVKSESTARPLFPARLLACGIAVAALLSLALFSGCTSGQPAASSSQAAVASSESAAVQQQEPALTATVIVKDADDPDAVPASYPVELAMADATAFDAFEAAGIDAVVEDGEYGKYISSIGGKAAEGTSGWVYTVNGEQVMESIDSLKLSDGDTIEFEYITM